MAPGSLCCLVFSKLDGVSALRLRNPEDWPLLEAYLQFAKSPWLAELGISVPATSSPPPPTSPSIYAFLFLVSC